MLFLRTFFLICGSLFILLTSVKAMESENDSPKYLSRFFTESAPTLSDEDNEDNIECCRYYSKASKISFNKDAVYKPEYLHLNQEIENRIQFFKNRTPTYEKVNFLTAILSATGSKNEEIRRVYENIYVRDNNGEPIILTSKFQEHDKILVLSSENFPDFENYKNPKRNTTFSNFTTKSTSPDPVHEFSHNYIENGEYQSIHNLFRSSSFSDDSPVRKKFEELYKSSVVKSHTEPLCLSVLLTLPEDTFENLLPEGYELQYYEIHLISNLDACESCPEKVYRGMEKLKERFGANLFMFFHGAKSFVTKQSHPYTIKYDINEDDYKTLDARFNFQDYGLNVRPQPNDKDKPSAIKGTHLDKRPDLNIKKAPSYYFGIIHELEGKSVNIKD